MTLQQTTDTSTKKGKRLMAYLTGNIKDFSFLFQRSITDNMSFRSDRDLLLFDAPINNIPAITKNSHLQFGGNAVSLCNSN